MFRQSLANFVSEPYGNTLGDSDDQHLKAKGSVLFSSVSYIILAYILYTVHRHTSKTIQAGIPHTSR